MASETVLSKMILFVLEVLWPIAERHCRSRVPLAPWPGELDLLGETARSVSFVFLLSPSPQAVSEHQDMTLESLAPRGCPSKNDHTWLWWVDLAGARWTSRFSLWQFPASGDSGVAAMIQRELTKVWLVSDWYSLSRRWPWRLLTEVGKAKQQQPACSHDVHNGS